MYSESGIDLRITWRSLSADACSPERIRNLRPVGTNAIVLSIAGHGRRIGAKPVRSTTVNNLEPPILIRAGSAKGVGVADIRGRERDWETRVNGENSRHRPPPASLV